MHREVLLAASSAEKWAGPAAETQSWSPAGPSAGGGSDDERELQPQPLRSGGRQTRDRLRCDANVLDPSEGFSFALIENRNGVESVEW